MHIVSPTGGSIGEITNDLIDYLSIEFEVTKEWETEILDEHSRDILLVHFLDSNVVEDPIFDTFKYKVLIQPIDGTRLIDIAVDFLNRFDLIICPAEASRNILVKNGIKVKITVIPNYYKEDLLITNVYSPITKHLPKNKIIIYHESTFHPRKGIELLYEAYIKAFSDTKDAKDVLLVLKDNPPNPQTFKINERLKREIIKKQKQYKNPASIIKFSTFLSNQDIKLLWLYTDIYISLAKIEGFGIPMLRMCLLEKPIICLDNNLSGYMDYLNKDNSYLIPSYEERSEDEFMWLYSDDSTWKKPKIDDIIDTLRLVVKEYKNKTHKKITKEQKSEYLKKYNIKTIAQKYIEEIKKIS